jgi:NAD(P)-dependent dehydrogenase (short-subunit alcohol dehydrogenase family)
MKPMHEVTTEEWDAILRTTLTGNVFWASKYAIPYLVDAGGGSIVNVSSGGSVFGVPGISAYSAAKGGMNAITRSIAVEYAPFHIRCNVIIVGRVVSHSKDRGPETTRELNRVGAPRDIAYAAIWLAADESEWITGTSVTADGGVAINHSEL